MINSNSSTELALKGYELAGNMATEFRCFEIAAQNAKTVAEWDSLIWCDIRAAGYAVMEWPDADTLGNDGEGFAYASLEDGAACAQWFDDGGVDCWTCSLEDAQRNLTQYDLDHASEESDDTGEDEDSSL